MKGLFRKDLYMLWSYCRIFCILLPLFLAASCFQPDNFFFAIYPSIIVGILPVTLMSYEEKCKWHTFCQTLPIPRWKVVLEKYLLSAAGSAVIFLISAVIQYGIFRQSKPFDWEGYQANLTLLVCLGLGSPGLLLPVIFRLGVEKGRLAYYFVLGGGSAIGGLLTVSADQLRLPRLSGLAICLIFAILFFLSCLLSIRFYHKRDL